MVASAPVAIRHLTLADKPGWHELWRAYQRFYRTSISEHVTEQTFLRILDPQSPIVGLVALEGARVVGLAHAIVTHSTWSAEPVIYLNDLFVATGMKGTGIGQRLIESVYDVADRLGHGQVWWLTHQSNTRARKLYDRVAHRSGHIHYARYRGGPQPGGECDP